MIEDVTLELELEKNGLYGVGSRKVGDVIYKGTMEFRIEDDESLKTFARLGDVPLVLVDAPSIGWEEKPFVAIEEK